MRFIERTDIVRASFVLLVLPLLAMLQGCGKATSGSWSETEGTGGTGEMSGPSSTATASGSGGTGGMGGSGGIGGMGGPTLGGTPLLAVLDDVTPYDSPELPEKDMLTVLDPANPNPPVFTLSGLTVGGNVGVHRVLGTSKSKKLLGVVDMYGDLPMLRVFDENLQARSSVPLPDDGNAVCPTDTATFVLLSKGAILDNPVVKFGADGSYVGTTSESHGVDMVLDEDRQVLWTVGKVVMRTTTDLVDEQKLHTFPWAAVSVDLDAQGGIWVAERRHAQVSGSVDQLVHFDVNGNIIGSDTLPLPGSPLSVRVAPSGLVWVAMLFAGVAYRNEDGKLEVVPGLDGSWGAVEADPFDSSRAWAVKFGSGNVVYFDKNGFIVQSFEGFSSRAKWLAVMLKGP